MNTCVSSMDWSFGTT